MATVSANPRDDASLNGQGPRDGEGDPERAHGTEAPVREQPVVANGDAIAGDHVKGDGDDDVVKADAVVPQDPAGNDERGERTEDDEGGERLLDPRLRH